jgi:hypothetical protein
VEAADNRIGIVDGNRPHISQRLDLGSHLLDLVVSHNQTELSDSGLDGVPACQTRGKVDVAGQAEIGGVENLVCAGVVEDRLGVNAGLVGESAEAGDGVVEGSVDFNSLGNHILNLLEHMELVLALDVVRGAHDHASKETAEGRDTVALTDAEHTGVNVGSTSLEGAVARRESGTANNRGRGNDIRIGDTAAGVVVEVCFNITRNNASERPDEVVDLSGGSTANSVGNTNAVHTNLVDRPVQR